MQLAAWPRTLAASVRYQLLMLTRVVGVGKDTGLTGPSGSMSVLCIPRRVISTVSAVGDRYCWALTRVDSSRATLSDTISILTSFNGMQTSATPPPQFFPTHFSSDLHESHRSPLASLGGLDPPASYAPAKLSSVKVRQMFLTLAKIEKTAGKLKQKMTIMKQ